MASPLFAGSEKRSSEVSRPASTARRNGRNKPLQRRTRNEKLADARTFVPDQNKNPKGQAAPRNVLGRGRLLRNLDSSEGQSVTKAQAVAAGFFILWSTLPLYVPQVTLWITGIGGIAAESVFLVNLIVPGEELFVVSYIFIAFIGLCSMVYAVVMFNARGVDCFGGHKALYFFLCLMGYFVFFINVVPWAAIWIISVMLNQSTQETEG